jgi:molybdopterin-containing oxidoreductase family membrane subunit
MPSLQGVFDAPGPVAEAARRLRHRGFSDLEIYAPAAFLELDGAIDRKPSRVRIFTLIGGLLGVVTGYTVPIWMSYDYPLMIGGNPFASIPTYTIIGFELTILFGGLATLLGLLAVGRLPYGSFGKSDIGYDARFSAEEFGLVVGCRERDVAEIDALLRAHQAKEVNLVEG